MPNYVAHEVMGDLIEIPSSRVNLDKELLSAFSVGHDLMCSEFGAINVTHNSKTREFFLTLIKYIKENKLYDNSDVMAFLYGHIMHYELDKLAHPYIYYMTNGVPKSGIVNFHMASEEYLGNFILNNKVSLSRKKISSNLSKISEISWSSSVGFMINDVYDDVYGYYNALSIMKRSALYLKSLEFFKKLLREEKSDFYYSFIGLEKYFKTSSMNKEIITNSDKCHWWNPISRREKDSSFLEMFDEAMAISSDVIEKVNEVIYGDKNLSYLDNVFTDDSYDTGFSCSIGKPFVKSRYNDLRRK